MSQTHLFTVEMTCEGCSNAVTRILNKLKGDTVEEFNVDLAGQKVSVTSSTLTAEDITTTLKKCGKPVSYVGIA